MLKPNFDPYNALIELNERMTRLEVTHNRLADAYMTSEQELNEVAECLLSLQKSHLEMYAILSKRV
jgi:hypothetical protein